MKTDVWPKSSPAVAAPFVGAKRLRPHAGRTLRRASLTAKPAAASLRLTFCMM